MPYNSQKPSEHGSNFPGLENATLVTSKEELDEIFSEGRYRQKLKQVLLCIASRLRQYRTKHACEPDEVLSDAYLRAEKYLEENGEIPNIFGWLKLTSHNIIRETKRREDRQRKCAQHSRSHSTSQEVNEIRESSVEANVISASQAVQKLSLLDQRILHHRCIIGLSWKEVCLALARDNVLDKDVCTEQKTLERIRRRGNRALAALRDGYY